MKLFTRHHSIGFTKQDPLANGLGDEIAAEQREADAFMTLDDTPGDELSNKWNAIVKDIEKDPKWFDFSND
jgi:hypothetical protein